MRLAKLGNSLPIQCCGSKRATSAKSRRVTGSRIQQGCSLRAMTILWRMQWRLGTFQLRIASCFRILVRPMRRE